MCMRVCVCMGLCVYMCLRSHTHTHIACNKHILFNHHLELLSVFTGMQLENDTSVTIQLLVVCISGSWTEVWVIHAD